MKNHVLIFIVLLNLQSIFAQDCSQYETTWMDDYWGEQCCDVAWDQWGFDYAYMESEYGRDWSLICQGRRFIAMEIYIRESLKEH